MELPTVVSPAVAALGSDWTFLDLTPLRRQEGREDTHRRNQGDAHTWWWRHDKNPAEVVR
jgi:predicted dithiol-disulfide oxidoreductase (DUF899 family)